MRNRYNFNKVNQPENVKEKKAVPFMTLYHSQIEWLLLFKSKQPFFSVDLSCLSANLI